MELQRVLEAEDIDAVRLARLRRASEQIGSSRDWLVELQRAARREARVSLESAVGQAWLEDLRALGLRPRAMVVDTRRLVVREPGR